MEKAYQRQYFENDKSPELNSDNLNKIDAALEEIDNRILQMHTRVFSAILALSNEPERISAENDRVVAENDRVAAENDRVVAEMEREEQIRLFVEAYTSAINKIYEDFAPVANLLTTEKGKALDATMGKELNDKITALQENGAGNDYYVGTCSTSASTADKVVTISDFNLKVGAVVHVKFSYTNTSSAATLNVSSTGAKAMYYIDGTRMYYIPAGLYHSFIYDGTYWRYLGTQNALVGNRGNEKYGLRMDGSVISPLIAGTTPDLGIGGNRFGTIYANHLGESMYPVATVYGNRFYTPVSGYTNQVLSLLPPLPLVKGNFTLYGSYYISSISDYEDYMKIITSGVYSMGGCGEGCFSCGNSGDPEALLLFRVMGYDHNSAMSKSIPFVHDVLLSTSVDYTGEATSKKTITTPNGNTFTLELSGITVGSCCVYGSPALALTASSTDIHFLEIDLIP